jgi:hypothetical protein
MPDIPKNKTGIGHHNTKDNKQVSNSAIENCEESFKFVEMEQPIWRSGVSQRKKPGADSIK